MTPPTYATLRGAAALLHAVPGLRAAVWSDGAHIVTVTPTVTLTAARTGPGSGGGPDVHPHRHHHPHGDGDGHDDAQHRAEEIARDPDLLTVIWS